MTIELMPNSTGTTPAPDGGRALAINLARLRIKSRRWSPIARSDSGFALSDAENADSLTVAVLLVAIELATIAAGTRLLARHGRSAKMSVHGIRLQRAIHDPMPDDGSRRVLVDRVWPRGRTRGAAPARHVGARPRSEYRAAHVVRTRRGALAGVSGALPREARRPGSGPGPRRPCRAGASGPAHPRLRGARRSA